MINVKIFDRKVKLRSFKEMLVSEYFLLKGELDPIAYIALQTSTKVEDLMAISIDRHLITRIANIDINSFTCKSIKYKGKTYVGFETYPYGVNYMADKFARDERENLPLWIFAAALNHKRIQTFNSTDVGEVYENLLKSKAIDVIPTLNLFIKHFFKKKVFTVKNLKLFMKGFLIIPKALIQWLYNFIALKTKHKK